MSDSPKSTERDLVERLRDVAPGYGKLRLEAAREIEGLRVALAQLGAMHRRISPESPRSRDEIIRDFREVDARRAAIMAEMDARARVDADEFSAKLSNMGVRFHGE
jgi:hypothetical protein